MQQKSEYLDHQQQQEDNRSEVAGRTVCQPGGVPDWWPYGADTEWVYHEDTRHQSNGTEEDRLVAKVQVIPIERLEGRVPLCCRCCCWLPGSYLYVAPTQANCCHWKCCCRTCCTQHNDWNEAPAPDCAPLGLAGRETSEWAERAPLQAPPGRFV